jgi:hypothetical protein
LYYIYSSLYHIAKTTTMNTPPFFAVQKQKINGETTLVAGSYTLDQKDIDPTTNLTLYVDTLTIPAQAFTLKGKNLTIFSRKIICSDGAVLDTSGASDSTFVPPYNPAKADNGAGAGQGGANGRHGGDKPETTAAAGQAAGGITINAGSISGKLSLKAVGGKGRQGQNGQDGGDGINGGSGNDAQIIRVVHDRKYPDGIKIIDATAGGDGGSAGNGGNAGKSGNGGAGGIITINTVTALTTGQIIYANGGGDAGTLATPGKAGRRGAAGPGGFVAEKEETWGHKHKVVWRISNTVRQGGARDGNAGTDGTNSAASRGADGAYRPATIAEAASLLNENSIMLSFLLLTMRNAEITYMERNIAATVDYYKWIIALTEKVTGTAGIKLEFMGICRQCRAYLDQLGQGLDYFANPMNYVPIVSLDYYEKSLDSMMQTGTAVEATYNDYTAYLVNQDRAFLKMDDAIAQAKQVLDAYKEIQENTKTQILSLPPVINQLSDALVNQYNVLMKANEAFQKAAEKKNNGGCSFASLLSLVKTVVGVGKSVFDAWKDPSLKSAGAAIKSIYDMGVSIDNGKIVADPQAIPSDPQSVATAWKSINPSGSGDVADSKKLIVLRDEFDKVIQPYLVMDEAKDYKKQLHDYIGIADARNAKMLEYTNAAIQYAAIIGKIAQKQQEVDRIKAQIAVENVPNLITYRNFIYNLYQDFKSFVLKYLYQENRAYIYWSQAGNDFRIEDDSFIGLGKFHNTLKGKIIDRINVYSQPSQPITSLLIELTPAGREEQFKNFREKRTISFNIPTNDPRFFGWANIMLTNFKIYVNGATLADTGNLYVQLVHHGSVFIVDPDDKPHDYTHNQVLSVFQYKFDKDGKPEVVAGGSLGGDVSGGNKKRIALSPFATFTVNVPEKYNAGSKLDNVQKIEIQFAGYAVPPHKMSKRVRKKEYDLDSV